LELAIGTFCRMLIQCAVDGHKVMNPRGSKTTPPSYAFAFWLRDPQRLGSTTVLRYADDTNSLLIGDPAKPLTSPALAAA
jgi:hypothetical protein